MNQPSRVSRSQSRGPPVVRFAPPIPTAQAGVAASIAPDFRRVAIPSIRYGTIWSGEAPSASPTSNTGHATLSCLSRRHRPQLPQETLAGRGVAGQSRAHEFQRNRAQQAVVLGPINETMPPDPINSMIR